MGFLRVAVEAEHPFFPQPCQVIPLVKGLNGFHGLSTMGFEVWVSCVLAMSAVPLAAGLRLGSAPLLGPIRVHPGDVLSWLDGPWLFQASLIGIDIEARDRALADLGPEGRKESFGYAGRLTAFNGPDKGEVWYLNWGLQTVGSSPMATHRIAGLAPLHIALLVNMSGTVLTALAPRVFVNDKACVREDLIDSDRLSLGEINLKFSSAH